MFQIHRSIRRLLISTMPVLAMCAPVLLAQTSSSESWQSVVTSDGSLATPRHEAGAVVVDGKLYLMGGRGARPVEVYDPVAGTWTNLGMAPEEMHHFQPVAVGSRIYVVGAMACCFPTEPPITTIHVFDTQTNSWSTAGNIPANRARGGAGAAVYQGRIYLVGGNTLGHSGGAVPWLDRFDPSTGEWVTLPDAPAARDHFQVALINDRLVATAGRESELPNPFDQAVRQTDIYNITTETWSSAADIPTARAGAISASIGTEVIVAGGEIDTTADALRTVEVFDLVTGQWRTLQSMMQGRHSGGGARIGDRLHMVAGSFSRGGAPEGNSHESLMLDTEVSADTDEDGLSNDDEISIHLTDPLDPDSDDDMLNDGDEWERGTDPRDADTDDDTLDDGSEVNTHGTDPLLADTDGDGLNDNVEIEQHGTDANLRDSDLDGLDDDVELELGTLPLSTDSDEDGLNDGPEVQNYGTDPLLSDSDSDQLDDAAEVNNHQTDPVHADTDRDGLDDGVEVNLGTDPRDADTDGDGILDGEERTLGSDPLNPDSDGDGTSDGQDSDPLGAPEKSGGGAVWWLIPALCVMTLTRKRIFPVK